MSDTKWLRRALLGGVALSVMATGAQADELSELKAQLEALQSRVNQLEARPAPSALPEGYSYMTYAPGQGSNSDWGNEAFVDQINQSNTRGFTVAVTPTADIPIPVAEVTVYGYVKGDVIYAGNGNEFSMSTAWSLVNDRRDDDDHITIHARQSRFGIKSKVDTAIGQIRTRIEGDFEGNGGNRDAVCQGNAVCGSGTAYGTRGNDTFRLRHAYGEWDMTENTTLIIGQDWHVAALLPLGISTVDFAGPAGSNYARDPQVKIRYSNGPLKVQLGIEEPLERTNTAVPIFGGFVQYDLPGGHTVIVSGAAGEADANAGTGSYDGEASYVLQGGFNINMADVATLTAAVVWGEGDVARRYTLSPFALAGGGDLNEVLGIMAGVSVPVSDTTTFNVVWDYLDGDANAVAGGGCAACVGGSHDQLHTIHANVMWQPAEQMRMGWEVLYLVAGDKTASTMQDEYIQIQWGTWFFF